MHIICSFLQLRFPTKFYANTLARYLRKEAAILTYFCVLRILKFVNSAYVLDTWFYERFIDMSSRLVKTKIKILRELTNFFAHFFRRIWQFFDAKKNTMKNTNPLLLLYPMFPYNSHLKYGFSLIWRVFWVTFLQMVQVGFSPCYGGSTYAVYLEESGFKTQKKIMQTWHSL